jgi:pimeloyl-ACP methyl ester carboxylesterase
MWAMRRILLILALLLAVLAVAGHWSGNQPRLDAVAAAQRELGVDLDARRVPVGDVELFVVRAGPPDGPPIVLLHGFPEFWYAWKGAIAPLAQAGFRVIVPDQRGYGDSDKPPAVDDYQIDRLGDDVANLIGALGYENAGVVGHDWGGGVAWNVAIRHPDRVRKLAVIDTPHPDVYKHKVTKEEKVSWYRTFFQIPLLPEEVARWDNWAIQSKMLRNTAAPGAFPDEKLALYRSAWDRDGAYGTMVNWYRASFRRAPDTGPDHRLAMPVLLLLTANDAFIPSDMTRASLELLDHGELVELGSGTHWVIQEEPDRIAALLARFFGNPEASP